MGSTLVMAVRCSCPRQRLAEFMDKADSLIGEVVGEEQKRMVVVGGLATAPERQGRGYASTLVHLATDLVHRS